MLAVAEGFRKFSHYTHEHSKLVHRLGTAGLISAGLITSAALEQFLEDSLNRLHQKAIILSSQKTDTAVIVSGLEGVTEAPKESPLISPYERISQYLASYIQEDLPRRGLKLNKILSNPFIIEPVQIHVSEPLGLNVRDFPDEQVGRKTGKLLPYDPERPLPGIYQYFVVAMDTKNRTSYIWALRLTKDDTLEAFNVYNNGSWNVTFYWEGQKIDSAIIFGPLFDEKHDQPPINKVPGKVL